MGRRSTPTHGAPAEDVAYAVGRLLSGDSSESEQRRPKLLNYVTATWDTQEQPLREDAQALAGPLRIR